MSIIKNKNNFNEQKLCKRALLVRRDNFDISEIDHVRCTRVSKPLTSIVDNFLLKTQVLTLMSFWSKNMADFS